MLPWSDLIVLGLAGHPEFPLQIPHKGGDPGLETAKIMILHFLSFGRHYSKEGAAGVKEIGTL